MHDVSQISSTHCTCRQLVCVCECLFSQPVRFVGGSSVYVRAAMADDGGIGRYYIAECPLKEDRTQLRIETSRVD